MAAEITCSKCGHRITVVDGQRIICPNCKDSEAVKALFAAPARPQEVHAVEPDGRPQITFVCPFCNEMYAVSEELAGKKINCRNCYEASRAPGKEKNAKELEPPPALPAAATEPWYYGFAEQLANVGMVVGGMACLAGFLAALSFVQTKVTGQVLGPLSLALAFVGAFFLVVGGMATIRVVVDAARKLPKRFDQDSNLEPQDRSPG